jgi:ElaB/YqjD/DUF883 family membrane-anchored ribosome-binding protein
MKPWLSIAVTTAFGLVVALIGFIVRRELGRQAESMAAVQKTVADLGDELAEEVRLRTAAVEQAVKDIAALARDCDARYLRQEVFDRLEVARKELDEARRSTDTELKELITELLQRHGGGRRGK